MKIGLVGLTQTGKTTLFSLLTQTRVSPDKMGTNAGMARVPDGRIDFLSGLYQPKKTTYAQIEFIDVAGLAVSQDGHGSGSGKFLQDVRPCDALAHVLRAFEHDAVIHPEVSLNPARDLEAVETELLFSDLEMVEKRIERIKTGKKITAENQAELARMERCYEWMEQGGSMRDMDLTEAERTEMRNYAFLTEKPRLAAVNLDENQYKSGEYPQKEALVQLCGQMNIPLLEINAQMELEISELSGEDKAMFMEDLGLRETGIEALAREVYKHLGLISFLTAGEDEVRAWTIRKGTAAREAAGKIHSDIERGFIRAEVVKYKDILELGKMAKVKEAGRFRLEGKEYVVEDGDVINFRFNV
ncbi:MAG: redox-regulated ATPase YchF [Peptococcaceae bacterium]|jgi:GTP-binding protein YchF|nr:redox-regulated ATPase YchF [Peptococcaceae bacterium]